MQFLTGILTGILVAIVYTKNLHQDLWQEITLAYTELQPKPTTPVEQAAIDIQVPLQPETLPLVPVPVQDHTIEQVSDSVDPIDDAKPFDGFQLAWMPFRSETSASGFADKLSRQLGRDFLVVKKGPGHYEVGFHYQSGQEREKVLDYVESLTGFRVPHKS